MLGLQLIHVSKRSPTWQAPLPQWSPLPPFSVMDLDPAWVRQWASYQLLPDMQNCGLCMRRECRERFPRHRLQSKPLVSDPGMHHGTCVTHVPWCMSGSLTRGGGENVPGIPGACATRNFTYLARGPWLVDITWANAEVLSFGSLETNFRKYSIKVSIQQDATENAICTISAILSRPQCITVKPVYNDRPIGYLSAFRRSSRWPRATKMSSRRQKLLTQVNWYLQSSLKHITE